jgi:hypothetical protein
LHQFERLVSSSVTAAAATGPSRSASGAAGAVGRPRRTAGTAWTAAASDQGGPRSFELGDLLLELAESLINLFNSAIDEAGSQCSLPLE